VYVLGLPYVTNRITINSEHDIVNVRLLSICPPAALRPYFQEGYLAGTTDVTTEFDSKTELDFRNRLVAKFAIPRAKEFWGNGFDQIPESALFPLHYRILELCNDLKYEIKSEMKSGDLGDFVKEWATLGEYLLSEGRRITERNVSIREAIAQLASRGIIPQSLADQIQAIRHLRNNVVHQPQSVQSDAVREGLERVREAWRTISRDKRWRQSN
jgi:hypothetical protein